MMAETALMLPFDGPSGLVNTLLKARKIEIRQRNKKHKWKSHQREE